MWTDRKMIGSRGRRATAAGRAGGWLPKGLTVKLLEDPVNGAGTPAAAHADVELVSVLVGHDARSIGFVAIVAVSDRDVGWRGTRDTPKDRRIYIQVCTSE